LCTKKADEQFHRNYSSVRTAALNSLSGRQLLVEGFIKTPLEGLDGEARAQVIIIAPQEIAAHLLCTLQAGLPPLRRNPLK
jgi:hypothetical protein